MRSEQSTPIETIYDSLADLKTSQRHYKSFFSSKFLNELEIILEKCFLPAKNKKEHFITKEKLTLDLIKLMQGQKKFKESAALCNQVFELAVMDKETQLCGRILSIDTVSRTIEFMTLFNLREKTKSQVKKFEELEYFEPRSLQMQIYYNLQKTRYDCFNYIDTFTFLTGNLEYINYFQEKKPVEKRITSLTGKSIMRLDSRYLNTDIQDK